jgi:hypothetical protein
MSAMRPAGTRSVATVSSTALHDIAGTGHLNRGFDSIFEIVRVVSRRFVSIAEVHSIRARAHAQSESQMARDRFGFLEHHGFVKSSSGSTHKAADTASFGGSVS